MFGLGLTELLIIGALVVLLLGPATSRRLFNRARTLWDDYRRLRAGGPQSPLPPDPSQKRPAALTRLQQQARLGSILSSFQSPP